MKTRKELENLLIEYGSLMGKKNFTPGTSGNMSFRYGDKVLITASGTANGYLKSGDFVLIDYDGNLAENSGKKPSSEKLLHTEIYKKRQDLNVVLHVHSPYLCSFAAVGIELDKPVMAEISYYFGKIPLADYALPSPLKDHSKTASPKESLSWKLRLSRLGAQRPSSRMLFEDLPVAWGIWISRPTLSVHAMPEAGLTFRSAKGMVIMEYHLLFCRLLT